MVPFDFAALVREIAADADFEARSHNRAVHLMADETCVIKGNPHLLRSAVENVVRNAAFHTAEGTTVEIALRCTQTEVAIVVRDRGKGVPPNALTDIFRPFFRVTDMRNRETEGTGLGLSITQRAVHWHGGTVKATNSIDGGLAVEIHLPESLVVCRTESKRQPLDSMHNK
jgi:two-component system sensor histidine kinase CpxA